MKLLKKVLLVNWHSFSKELIDIGTINFLTGKNAVGKSTIIDAMQLVILGDTRGTSFNKAASEKSGRTLISYLKGEIGTDNDGNKKYLRPGEFASYVVLEFYDDINDCSFVIGNEFDVSGDKFVAHEFIYDGTIPHECFVANNKAMDFKTFKDFVTIAYTGVNFPDSLNTYKEDMRKKLGSLSNRFFPLFKKAVPFTPIYDIRKFITEFVCDIKYDIKSDLEKMQDNIRNYTSLEVEAKNIQNRITYLTRIHDYYETYIQDKNKCDQADYLVAKLEIAKKQKEIVNLHKNLEDLNERLTELQNDEVSIQSNIDSWKQVRDTLLVEKSNNDAEKKHQGYLEQQDQINKSIASVKDIYNKSATRLVDSFVEFETKAKQIHEMDFDKDIAKQAGVDVDMIYKQAFSIMEKAQVLATISAENLNKFTEAQIADLCDTVASLEDLFTKVRNGVDAIKSSYEDKIREYGITITTLRNGKKTYPQALVEFKEFIEGELSRKYGKAIEMDFLADLMEIKDKKWQAALETYLYGQKFAFVIDPKYFNDAMNIYSENRNRFYDMVILDSAKLISNANRYRYEKGSLAEEIETEHQDVRTYINLLIGNLTKVYSVDDLNKYDRSITPTGMLYQQFTTRQMNMSRGKTPFIGNKATESQIQGYEELVSEIESDVAELDRKSAVFYQVGRFNNLSSIDIGYHYKNLQQIYQIDELNAQLADINNKIDSIDLSSVEEIQERINEVDGEIRYGENQIRQHSLDCGSIMSKIDDIQNDKIITAQNILAVKEAELNNKFPSDWILANVSEDINEMLAYITEDQISKKLSEARKLADTLGAKHRNLERARTDYVKAFASSLDTTSDNNDKFEEELVRYRDIALPDYLNRITEAKGKTYDQFKEDLLSKLKSSIESVNEQIETLNNSLANFQFGHDKYEFKVRPNPTYQNLYDMIMDELLMNDARTNSQAFYDKYKDTIDEFFARLTEAPGANDQERREIIDKNVALYTDYRTYLDFDLFVRNDDTKSVQSLAKSMGSKSGGETQTPFYISILASIANEYRIGLGEEESNTPRLILFDEAFNKMDPERIKESINLLKKFGLQALLVAPPEKVSEIAPLVDRNLCVIRRKNNAFVKTFTKEDIEELSEQ